MQARVAIRVECLGQPLRRAIDTAASWGVSGVAASVSGDLDPGTLSETGRRELRRMLENRHLTCACLVFPAPSGLMEPAGLDARLQALRQTFSLAHALRCSTVCCSLGPLPAADDAQHGVWTDVLSDLTRDADRMGAALALRNGREAPEALRSLAEGVRSGWLAVSFDPAPVIVSGGDPAVGVRALAERIAHVHARDAVRSYSGEAAQEVALGQGSLDWDDYLTALEEIAYRGFFTVERSAGRDPAGDLRRGVEFLRNVAR